MNKKKILMVTEFSQLPTGYSVYSKEVLSRLHQVPNFDVAELACYCSEDDLKIKSVPWRIFPNKPKSGTPEYDTYKSSSTSEFGEFSFNSVLLNFKPDFVFDIRDFWMLSFEQTSPFRAFYNWAIMPTVDAEPQNIEWMDTYAQANAVFTYSEFGRDTLLNHYSGINFKGVASPCASYSFHPMKEKDSLRQRLGISNNIYIIGTVMRNQRRKLYPDLFKSFRKLLDETGRENVYLYCHTSFPDVGWDIPQLLLKYNIGNKVLFTYKCTKCNNVSCSFFHDVIQNCDNCNNFTSSICGINNPISEQELATVYNVFDIYVQYANSEGFGMPQLEAAQCGNVVCSIDYSAMSSVIKNIGGIPIKVAEYATEGETGCLRAIPNNKDFIEKMKDLISKSRDDLKQIGRKIYINTLKHYNWDTTAKQWIDYFNNTETMPLQNTWMSPIKILKPSPINESLKNPLDQANFLISQVLCKPELIGTFLWRRLLKELTYKGTVENINSFYLNESHYKDVFRMKPFSYQDAYHLMVQLREYYNLWESHRAKYI